MLFNCLIEFKIFMMQRFNLMTCLFLSKDIMVEEYAQLGPLDVFIRRQQSPLSTRWKFQVAKQLASALSYLVSRKLFCFPLLVFKFMLWCCVYPTCDFSVQKNNNGKRKETSHFLLSGVILKLNKDNLCNDLIYCFAV